MAMSGALSWVDWRNRLLCMPRFQRWATRIPLVRSFSRPHARSLFDLCTGFVNSQVLYVSLSAGLLEAMRCGPVSAAELQASCRIPAPSLRLLLEASDALRLTEPRRQGRWGLGVLGAAILGNPAVQQMVRHQPLFYADMAQLLPLLRGSNAPGELERYWAYARVAAPDALADAAVSEYSDLMDATHALVVDDLLGAYDFARHSCVLDVGGGQGAMLRALAGREQGLRLVLFDLPAVAERARVRLAAAGLGARIQVESGDFFAALPSGADLITLVRIAHDHDDAALQRLLVNAHAALPPGGQIVIAEPMRGIPGSMPVAETYLGFYLLAMGQGRVRTQGEIDTLLRRAGFGPARLHATPRPWQCAVLSARRA
jgi:demethylspheroidene O-methyltransferase